MGVPECHTPKRDLKIAEEMERNVYDNRGTPTGRFYRLSTGRAAHYQNLKPHVPCPEDWCVPQNMEGIEYLLVERACEVNEKGTREKNDGNEDVRMDDNEKIEVDHSRRKIGMIQSRTRYHSGQNQTSR